MADRLSQVPLRRRLGSRLHKLAWTSPGASASPPLVGAIHGVPRSGTTWILECFERRYGVRRIWEPFNPLPYPYGHASDAEREAYNLGLGLRPYLRPEEDHAEVEGYLNRIYSADAGAINFFPLPLSLGALRSSASNRPAVAKFVRSMRLLPWMAKRFAVRNLVILRDPLAVVASQLHHAGWQSKGVGSEHPVLDRRLLRDFPALEGLSERCVEIEERLALTVCIDLNIAGTVGNRANCQIVPYEHFVDHFEDAFATCDRFFALEPIDRGVTMRHAPSRTTTADSNVMSNQDPKRSWEKRLTTQQIDRIRRVIGDCAEVFAKGRDMSAV